MYTPELRTADGFELQIGTNHLGHFALTNLLLPHITGRVVTVASNAHKPGKVDLGDLNWEHRPYNFFAAYNQSKLANLLFTGELTRKLTTAGITGDRDRRPSRLCGDQFDRQQRFVDQGNHHGGRGTASWPRAPPPAHCRRSMPPWRTFPATPTSARRVSASGAVGRRSSGAARAARDRESAVALWSLSEELTGTSFPL